MKDFNLKKYLAENKLLKEDISSHKEEAKRFLEKFIDDNKDAFEFIPDLETGYINTKDNSYNVDELASIFLDMGQDIPRGKYNQKYKGEGGTYVVVAEGKLLKENMSLTMDELEKLANLKSDEFKSSPKKLVDMVMGSVKFNLEKDGTNIENASKDEIDKLRYKWARLKGLLKVKDTFTSMYGKRGVKTNTDKDLLDKIKVNIQDEDLLASQAIDILDEFRVYAESEDLIQYLNQSMDYLERIPSNDDVYSAIQAVADGLNPYTGEEFDYEVDDMQSELERLIN